MADRPRGKSYNGRLSIPLPFEDALKAATEVKPAERKPKKKRAAKKS